LKELAARRMRFGYRRLTAILVSEGLEVNHKRVYRLYREEGLAMRILFSSNQIGVFIPEPMVAFPQITAAQIREHYDSLAFFYRTFWGDHIHHGLFLEGNESPDDAQVQMLDYCVDLVNLQSGDRVLDVGCGHGGTLLHLARLLSCTGTGLTISPKQASLAREHAAQARVDRQVSFVVENADSFEFPASAFDLVWTMESSEHFADKSRYFANVERTLRPGGKLLLAAWTGSMDRYRVREVARAFLCPELWTARQYQSAVESTGMQSRRCEDMTPKIVRTWDICQERARSARPVIKLLPRAAREFVDSVDIILDAYRSGDLTYTLLAAMK
jgi:tocopherol O-methyltransferase